MMDRGWVTWPRVKYWVEYGILGKFLSKKVEFLSKKVEFLLESVKNKWGLVEYLFDYDP